MVVLLTGASGFIGSRLAQALAAAGYDMICALRDPRQAAALGLPGRAIAADFTRDVNTAAWLPRLRGVDVVVNAAGILRQTRTQTFAALHTAGPCALFAACAACGVRRVVQISALGADEQAQSSYHRSKKAADEFLLELPVDAVVVQPSLVYGAGGTSARLFTRLASLPVIPLPGSGEQRVQPIHVDDAVAALTRLVAGDDFGGQRVPLVGPQPLTLRQLLGDLRGAMGLPRARFLAVPIALVRAGATIGGALPGSLLDRDTLAMLARGNCAPADATRRLLGRAPRAPADFIAPALGQSVRTQAQLGWLLPLLRLSIALVWIVTGIVSLGLFPRSESYALLGRVGVTPFWAPAMLLGAALLDFAFGIGTLLLRRRRWLWMAQIALIAAYTAIISVFLPEFWLHPFGPILKNLPLVAAIAVLLVLERDEST